jgi:hypothetical protein
MAQEINKSEENDKAKDFENTSNVNFLVRWTLLRKRRLVLVASTVVGTRLESTEFLKEEKKKNTLQEVINHTILLTNKQR